MLSLSFLFLMLPLYFSHVFMHFGVVMGDTSFERQKMYLFILMVLIALAEMIFTRYDTLIVQIRKYGLIIFGLILLPLVPTFLYGAEIDTYWIRGSYEKFHGYLLYVGIIILGFCISLLDMHEKKKIVQLSFIPLGIVSIIAILEGLSIQVFFPPSSGIWGEGVRAISTLGNPNYLAGYLLIMLPLIGYLRAPERYIVGFLIFSTLITTWSYIGITIVLLYGLYYIISLIAQRYSISRWIYLLIFTGIAMSLGVLGYFLIPTDKLLSLSGRFVLMGEIGSDMIRYPFVFLTGYGPEAILRFFYESRSAIVDAYFPRNSIIDSSHNILLDFVFQYGILPLILLASTIYKNYHAWNPHARASWMLGIAFLMFNPYVVAHLIFLTLTLSLHGDRK